MKTEIVSQWHIPEACLRLWLGVPVPTAHEVSKKSCNWWSIFQSKRSILLRHFRARNKGRSTDNVRTDCGFDRSNFRLAGYVDRSKFSRIENEINLRFLLFSCFSCYLSSSCEYILRNLIWNPVTCYKSRCLQFAHRNGHQDSPTSGHQITKYFHFY